MLLWKQIGTPGGEFSRNNLRKGALKLQGVETFSESLITVCHAKMAGLP